MKNNKKRIINILVVTVLACLILAGCGSPTSVKAQPIGLEAAKAVALEDAGLSASAVSFSTTGLDRQGDTEYYAIDFTSGDSSYEYDIDAISGRVIECRISQGTASAAQPQASAQPQTTAAPGGSAVQADSPDHSKSWDVSIDNSDATGKKSWQLSFGYDKEKGGFFAESSSTLDASGGPIPSQGLRGVDVQTVNGDVTIHLLDGADDCIRLEGDVDQLEVKVTDKGVLAIRQGKTASSSFFFLRGLSSAPAPLGIYPGVRCQRRRGAGRRFRPGAAVC